MMMGREGCRGTCGRRSEPEREDEGDVSSNARAHQTRSCPLAEQRDKVRIAAPASKELDERELTRLGGVLRSRGTVWTAGEQGSRSGIAPSPAAIAATLQCEQEQQIAKFKGQILARCPT